MCRCFCYQDVKPENLCSISMSMEPKFFNNLVETLLEPKNLGTRQKPYRHEEHILDEQIKLIPKDELRPCGDCAQPVKNRTIHYVVYAMGTKNQHWKKCCTVCGEKQEIRHPFLDQE